MISVRYTRLLAERETFTSLVLAIRYRVLLILYRDLVPCFVIARVDIKKLRCTLKFLSWDEKSYHRDPCSHLFY